jgi:hypothetical protein
LLTAKQNIDLSGQSKNSVREMHIAGSAANCSIYLPGFSGLDEVEVEPKLRNGTVFCRDQLQSRELAGGELFDDMAFYLGCRSSKNEGKGARRPPDRHRPDLLCRY